MTLHPKLAEMIAGAKENPRPPVRYTPLDKLRADAQQLAVFFGEREEVHWIENVTVTSGENSARLRLYYPGAAQDGPVLLYFHSGGYIRGDIDTFDLFFRALCNESQMVVAALDYSPAPEAQFPVQLKEAQAALLWLQERQFSQIVIGGESSGGNLAAALALHNRDGEGIKVAAQLLVCPQLDYTHFLPAHKEFATGYLLEEDALKFYRDQFIPKGVSSEDPFVSPLFADDLRGLPPAVILTAEYDVLRDDGAAFAEKLRESGVHVDHQEFKGMTHGFFQMLSVVGRQGMEYAMARLRERV